MSKKSQEKIHVWKVIRKLSDEQLVDMFVDTVCLEQTDPERAKHDPFVDNIQLMRDCIIDRMEYDQEERYKHDQG